MNDSLKALIFIVGFTLTLLLGGITLTNPSHAQADIATLQQMHQRINLNAATEKQILLLPDIGPTLAKRIIESRQTDGPFKQIEDLQRINGIGPITAQRLQNLIRYN